MYWLIFGQVGASPAEWKIQMLLPHIKNTRIITSPFWEFLWINQRMIGSRQLLMINCIGAM